MGNWFSGQPPPPMVLVPPLFDYPPLAARTRMLVPSYDLLFGKLALRCLLEDYYEEKQRFITKIMLKPIDDPHFDVATSISGPLELKGNDMLVDALFRWQKMHENPHNFCDLFVSNYNPALRLRSSIYMPEYGMGAFASLRLFCNNRTDKEDYLGVRYGSQDLSIGATVTHPFLEESLKSFWMVGKLGNLTAGWQFKPPHGSSRFLDPENYSCAISYGSSDRSLLNPSYNLRLELVQATQFVASFYQHLVVQRRVQNPFEENQIVGITNYIDFGFELNTRIDGAEVPHNAEASTFSVGAAWQANKNFLLKGKVGPKDSSMVLSFKSWWKPSFTFSITALRDHFSGKLAFGFGLRIEDLREVSYERADPNYILLTPTKEHLAEGIIRNTGKRPMLQSDLESKNMDNLPKDLQPTHKLI